jgi:hypothetical protein
VNELNERDIEEIITKHSVYIPGSPGVCAGCDAPIGLFPHDNPIPPHQADVLYDALYGPWPS